MNWVLFLLVLLAYLITGWEQLGWTATQTQDVISPMQHMNQAMLDASSQAITLALGLIGVMMLFLGLIKILEQGGALTSMAKLLYPLFKPLFPEIPPEHPAMGAMMMNLSANILGLGNAATPFGIRAMQSLNQLNPTPGTATNAMILFLVINTTCVTVLPTKIIAMRSAAGSADPAGVIPTILTASLIATILAVLLTKFIQRFFPMPIMATMATPNPISQTEHISNVCLSTFSTTPTFSTSHPSTSSVPSVPIWASIFAISILISLIPVTIFYGHYFSPWVIPTLTIVIFSFGMIKKIKIYECFIEGAKEGFDIAIKIMPYLVAILLAVAMFRESGGLDYLTRHLGQYTDYLGLPPEALPMALLRPFSGSGSFGLLASVLNDPNLGPDSYVGYLVSTLMGTTETSFYVLAVYFGAVQIKRFRHAVIAAVIADIIGVVCAVTIVSWLYTG
jgi:spore maturation protein SpmA